MAAEPHQLSVTELRERIREGDLSPVTVVDSYLDRIGDHEELNAFVTTTPEAARERAAEAERALERGADVGPLHGVPVAIKDLHGYKAGVRHTFGATPFAAFVPEESAIFVERLEAAGAIVVGKTNTPEFGAKGTTDNELVGATGTPFDPTKTAGGSSGGSAAAVAAGLVPLAQGSDVGGSIRIPASCCGVFGFYPSFGRVPHAYRPNAFVSHTPFQSVGPLARTVEDAALFLDVVAGPDPRDPLSLPDDGTDYLAATRRPVDDLQVAYSPDFDVFPVDERVATVVEDALTGFEAAGASVEEVRLGHDATLDDLVDAHRRLKAPYWAELRTHLREEHGVDLLERDDIPDGIRDAIRAGQDASALDARLANVVRTAFYDAVREVLADADVLVTPTLGVPPFDKEEVGPTSVAGREIDPTIGWFLTFPLNMVGYPTASVPAGVTDDGLPVGMQVVGPQHRDDLVLAASAAFERARPWRDDYPFVNRS